MFSGKPAKTAFVKWLFFSIVLFAVQGLYAQTSGDFRSAANNANWSSLSSWERWNGTSWQPPTSGQGYPGQFSYTGNVIIRFGGSINLDVSPANVIGSLNVGDGTASNSGLGNVPALLSISTFTLTISGNIVISNADGSRKGTLDNGSGVVKTAGLLSTAGGGTYTASTGTFEYNANGNQNIFVTMYHNLIASGSGTKTFGASTTIAGNLKIGTGVVANLGTFQTIAATLTLDTSPQGTGTSYGGTTSPAENINSVFFAVNTGYLNVGSCSTYSLTSIGAAAAVCAGNAVTIIVASTADNLPNGTYTVRYTLGAPNAGTGSVPMIVSGDTGTGSFATLNLASSGSTSITINHITNGCVSQINSGNTATITVKPNNTAGAPSSAPTLCVNTMLTAITHTTVGATGIGTTISLPAGVSASWSANEITINGTPTASGTFNYGIQLTGGCGNIYASGTITVTPDNTTGKASSTPTLCVNTALTAITHTTTGATGIGTPLGLPMGVSASWSADKITISGSPTASGIFNYIIPLTGGCGSINATGTITVNGTPVGGFVTGGTSICSGLTSGLLTLSGETGTVVRWESAVAPFDTWKPIANTSTSYISGVLTETTQFRAVVRNACSEVNSTPTQVTTVTATTTTWTGSGWDNGIPDTTKLAVIAAGTTYTSSGNIVACSLTVKNNAIVVISSGDSVILSGALLAETGSFVSFDNNASLIQSGTTPNTGEIKIIRNSHALKLLDYTLWSSPVTGVAVSQTLLDFSPLTVNSPPDNVYFFTYNTSTNLYSSVNPSATTFATGKGYLIRMPDNHPANTPTIWPATFTGVPNNGNYSVVMNGAGEGFRFNSVGNPYPSPIDAVRFIDDPINADPVTGMTGTLYFWRKTNNAVNPSYCTMVPGFSFTDNGVGTVLDPADVIQTGQGFLVEALADGATALNFTNAMRIDDHADQFLKTTKKTEKSGIWLNATNSTGSFSQMMVGYAAGATLGADRAFDGKYFNDGNIALTSLIDATPYTIQGRPLPFDVSDVVPLSFMATIAGSYTIALDHVDGLFSDTQNVYLHDNVTGAIHDLKAGGYNFASDAGSFASRFEIVYQPALGVTTPVFDANQVVVYKGHNDDFVVNTGNVTMATVKVFDISGRLLFDKKEINQNETTFYAGLASELLIVQITDVDGTTVVKKVIR